MEVPGRRTCGLKTNVVTELLKTNKKRESWWNDRGSDAACQSSCGGVKAASDWKNDENATCKELQQEETHERGRHDHGREIP